STPARYSTLFPYTTLFRSTELQLTCQRCLETLQQQVNAAVNLIMVWSQETDQALPESYDPWLITEDKMDVSTLLEDEILLSLPRSEEHTSELQSRFDLVCR